MRANIGFLALVLSALALPVHGQTVDVKARDRVIQPQVQRIQRATEVAPSYFRKLASEHDFVGIVQVEDINYERVQGRPESGRAMLEVLVAYKRPGEARTGRIIVQEKGVGPETCYYPEPLFEGPRYLAFLDVDDVEQQIYNGTAPDCQLPVMVTKDMGYALVYPIDRYKLSDESMVQELTFTDPHAWFDLADLSGVEKQWLEDYFDAELRDGSLVYTRGIQAESLHRMLFPERFGEGEGNDDDQPATGESNQ